jgi:phospholipid N-methyltransferase
MTTNQMQPAVGQTEHAATYSPEDNKLRLYPACRLDPDEYAKMKAAGFSWAPKQELFVAPVWTPTREDLLVEMCGEIGDEDTSLVDRSEQRAERFADYSDNRRADAERSHEAVSAIVDGIPMGQPILIGHHSEKHARKDAEKIQNGMRRAVKMWEQANYWKSRAAVAIRAAKYKELPAVRARRIKGIEADIRSYRASYTPHDNQPAIMQTRWNAEKDAPAIPHVWVGPKGRGGHWVPLEDLPRIEAGAQRWLEHLQNRLEYERAMLAEGGGLAADGFDIQIGGRVFDGGSWLVVTKLNRKDGALFSVSVLGRWSATLPVEQVRDYKPPEAGDAEKVAAVSKLAPLCNFRAEGCIELTSEEWKRKQRISDSYFVHTFKATETTGAYRLRTAHGPNWSRLPVFLTDAKVVEAPALKPAPEPVAFAPIKDAREWKAYQPPEPTKFDALRETLKAGVQVVTADQLFPTPPDLAARMVEAADIQNGDRVLEPSAGTGNIARAVFTAAPVHVVAVEINRDVLNAFEAQYHSWNNSRIETHCADFLACNDNLGKFDRILMNPPFSDGADVKHIRHALTFLKPGGRLVAICANGPRQREALMGLGTWEDLPAGTFKASGTGVNAAMLIVNA